MEISNDSNWLARVARLFSGDGELGARGSGRCRLRSRPTMYLTKLACPLLLFDERPKSSSVGHGTNATGKTEPSGSGPGHGNKDSDNLSTALRLIFPVVRRPS